MSRDDYVAMFEELRTKPAYQSELELSLVKYFARNDPHGAIEWARAEGELRMGQVMSNLVVTEPGLVEGYLREAAGKERPGSLEIHVARLFGAARVDDGLAEVARFCDWAPVPHLVVKSVASSIGAEEAPAYAAEWNRRYQEGNATSSELITLVIRWKQFDYEAANSWSIAHLSRAPAFAETRARILREFGMLETAQ
jgi:hypothetical protein